MELRHNFYAGFLRRGWRNSNGFSMLEAVVVVGVVLALAIGGFFAYGAITENAKKATVKAEASKVYTAVQVAQIDGDPSSNTAQVLEDYNNSNSKVRVAVRKDTEQEFSATPNFNLSSEEGFCLKAELIGEERIFSETGSCVVNPGGENPGGGDGPGPVLPISYAKSFQCGDGEYGVTAAQVDGNDKSSWDSYVLDEAPYLGTYPMKSLTFKNAAGETSNVSDYPASVIYYDLTSAGLYTACSIDYKQNNILNSTTRPSQTTWINNFKLSETWYADGQMHREGDLPSETTWVMNSANLSTETWHKNGLKDRDGGPAYIAYNPDSSKPRQIEEWYKNNKLNRLDGPARIHHSLSGVKTLEEWQVNDQRHRTDGPALTNWNSATGDKSSEHWYENGKLHRLNEPASIILAPNGMKQREVWSENGITIREKVYNSQGLLQSEYYYGNPGAVYTNSRWITYYTGTSNVQMDKWTNTGAKADYPFGPASTTYYSNGQVNTKEWRKNGALHRTDGPALESWYENGNKKAEEYYVDGHLDYRGSDQASSTSWYENGQLFNKYWYKWDSSLGYVIKHNVDAPARITFLADGKPRFEEWYVDGQLHRMDGPAFKQWDNGVLTYAQWYENGVFKPTPK